MEFIVSQRGKPKLIWNGNLYTQLLTENTKKDRINMCQRTLVVTL